MTIFLYYILILLLFLIIFSSFIFLLTPLFSLIPFVPVRKKILHNIISSLELKEQDTLYDLGCGDGRVLFMALKTNPNISCVGIEIAPFPFLIAKIKQLFYFSKNIHIIYGNFFNINISPASCVFLYLFPKALDNLLHKLEKELKSGSKVVSCDFYFSKRKPDKIIKIMAKKWQKNKNLYIYNF